MSWPADLAYRRPTPERMDDPHLDPAEHRRALRGLARLNRLSGSAELLWPRIVSVARRDRRPLRVLDVATGAGDVPVRLARKAAAAGLTRVTFAGCDVSPTAVAAAAQTATDSGVSVAFFRHDAIADPLPAGYDVVTCSLFLHHLSDADAVTLLRRMAAAGRTVLVNDLARGPLNYALVWLASRACSRSPVVHFDGPASVRSAYTPGEALALAEKAGLTGARVLDRPPCRFLLTWRAGTSVPRPGPPIGGRHDRRPCRRGRAGRERDRPRTRPGRARRDPRRPGHVPPRQGLRVLPERVRGRDPTGHRAGIAAPGLWGRPPVPGPARRRRAAGGPGPAGRGRPVPGSVRRGPDRGRGRCRGDVPPRDGGGPRPGVAHAGGS